MTRYVTPAQEHYLRRMVDGPIRGDGDRPTPTVCRLADRGLAVVVNDAECWYARITPLGRSALTCGMYAG